MSDKDKNILGAFLLVRHLEELTIEEIKDVQQAIKRVWNNFDKAIEYIKENNCIAVNKEYLPKEYEWCCSAELLKILGDKE